MFAFVVAAVASMVIHLFGPVAHADTHSEFASLASGTTHQVVAADAAGPAAKDHGSGGSAGALDQARAVDDASLSAGGASHEDAGCGSLIRASGSSLNHVQMGCATAAWPSRADNRNVLPLAVSVLASPSTAGGFRNLGVQRI